MYKIADSLVAGPTHQPKAQYLTTQEWASISSTLNIEMFYKHKQAY